MKSCKYYYKGKLIGNILELDDFLLTKQKYYSKYGDLVFKRVNVHAVDILKQAQKDNELIVRAWNTEKRSYAGEEELIKLKRPLVGVTEFLSGQRNSIDNKLYFPEFKEEEYWSRRYNAWTNAKKAKFSDHSDGFTQDEIDIFFEGDETKITAIPLGNPDEWKDPSGNFKPNFGTDEQKILRDKITDKWQHQAKYGTEIHNILEMYFKAPKSIRDAYDEAADGKNNMYFGKLISDLRRKYTAEVFDEKGNLVRKEMSKITDVTTDQKIKETLQYAKQLREEIELKYSKGGEVTFFPEFVLSANLNKEFDGRTDLKISGRVDLLFLDGEGYPHIVDYKTSPKQFEDYNSAKKLGFTYQLATYSRMLSRLGLRTDATNLIVAPIQMENFHLEGDKWTYDSITKGTSTTTLLKELNADTEDINRNLNDFIEAPLVIDADAQDIISKVRTTFDKWFPKYGSDHIKTDEEIREMIEKQGGFTVNSSTGDFEFTPKGWSKPITATKKEGEAALFAKVKDIYTGSKEKNIKKTQSIKHAINVAKTQKSNYINLPKDTDDWVRHKLSKYLNDNWKIMNDDAADAASQFGMLLFHNEQLDVIEVVKISNKNLKYLNNWGDNRTNLTGAHDIDLSENSRSDSFMLKAANGNIELMEAMLVLNACNFNRPIQIGRIDVISPFSTAQGLSASNKELLYCWNKLNHFANVEGKDNFRDNHIKMLTKAEACYIEFSEIVNRVGDRTDELSSNIKSFQSAVNQLHKALPINNVDEALSALYELKKKLEENKNIKKDTIKGRSVHNGLRDYDTDYERILYQQVSQAILELNRFDIRQALTDHDQYLQSMNIFRKGISGNMLDNAGNFGNQLLNQITSLALEGYQNGRDMAYKRLNQLRLKTEKLKKDLGFSGIKEHTIGNQTSLYNGMTEYTADGDLRFINPWKNNKLNTAQQDYLKFIILEINKNKYPNLSETQIQQKINSNDIEFFQVPLIEASFASKVNTEGWTGWFKNKCKRLSKIFRSKEAFKKAMADLQSEYLSDAEEQTHKSDEEIFKATNLMDQGNGEYRKDIIHKKISEFGEGFFERDLESILSSHIWAYSTQEALEDRMPLLKAAYTALAVMGNEQNYDFENDEKFFQEFVANRINKQSIVNEKLKWAKGVVGIAQQAASWMALAFSPLQFTYQSLEAIWKNCKLIIAKPDGTDTFTAQNMFNAAKTVYKELAHFSDKPYVTTAINAQYGINDMDNAAFAQNNTSNRHGLFNFFGKFAYKFSSRPDFYNRMTIFVAQMQHDGSWEAHSINSAGELVYDWKKDKRFEAFAKDPEGKNGKTEAWNKAKALYYATATQLVAEGARNTDGTLFTISSDSKPTPLPKAYSNKESEAKKAVGDSMYGYYDSTKKSLFQATFIGGLMMQMRTYWSAKKNQYFAPGGVKAQGQWVHAEEMMKDPKTGEMSKQKLYYSKLDNGQIDRNGPLVTENDPKCSKVPFLQWKGKFEEGIAITIADTLMQAAGALSKGSISDAYNAVKNKFSYNDAVDPELTKAYRSNLQMMVTDIFIMLFIGSFIAGMLGDWADDEDKEFKKSGHMSDAFMATFANLCYRTFKNSSLDANWINAIFDVSMDWNPFATTYLANETKVLWDFITDDTTASETLIESMSAARQMRPILQCLSAEE